MIPAEKKAHEEIESDTITSVGDLKEAAQKDGIAPGTRWAVSDRLQRAIDKVKAKVANWEKDTEKRKRG